MLTFVIIAFVAGVLTVLAPCILPLLPVVVGSSASGRSRTTPYVVVFSLAISIIVFTYVLKVSTAFIMIPPEVWTYLSGGIIFFFGFTLFFPNIWDNVPGINKISISSNKLLGAGYGRKSFLGDMVVGAALGPVFSTCSPTYFVILASVLPASFILGSLYLFSYTLGLSIILLFIALLGQRFVGRLSLLSDPRGWFKRGIGLLFILLGLSIAFGYEKKLETAILDSGYFDITKVERYLLKFSEGKSFMSDDKTNVGPVAPEIVNPSGFINTNDKPIAIGEMRGKKVILLDIWTYSCINCQRTLPYVEGWYEKYKDMGLVVIGLHTPEFAFEKIKANVEEAAKEFCIFRVKIPPAC